MSSEGKKLGLIHGGFLVFIFAYAAYEVVQWRNISHSIDLISYLDIGDAYWRGDFQHAFNHYWSPMYSWILGGVMAICRPGIDQEMLAVRLTNFALLALLVSVFVNFARTFWRQLSGYELKWLSEPLYWVYMYCLLAFCALGLGGCDKDTPDMLVSSFALLASTAFLKIKMGDRKNSNFAMLGAMLGFGYLAKAIILPISLFYYLAAWWEMRKESAVWKHLAVAAVVQLCIAGPFIAAISLTFGHLTFSDATRTIALYSNSQHDQQVHFQFPELKHKSRKIFENPDVYEFSEPIGGTYPPWNNPAYWTEGAPDRDPLNRAIRYALNNVRFFLIEIFSFLLLAWLLTSIYLRRSCITLSGLASSWTIAAPSLVAVGIYAITTNLWGHFMERYFVAWVILPYSAAILAARFPDSKSGVRGARIFLSTMGGLMLVVVLSLLFLMHAKMPQLYPFPYDAIVAHKIQEVGLKPGDKIAQIGFRRYYWARLARLKIVADIFDIDGFWQMEPVRRDELINTLRQNGVKAIVQTWAVDKPEPNPGAGWIPVPHTAALIYLIPPDNKSDPKAH